LFKFIAENKREFSLLFFIAILFFIFLPPNVTTGDSGELITASQLLGVGHASGYPLYLLLLKTVSFIPIGNIAFRCALLSAFFSLLSLFLCIKIVKLITNDFFSSFFPVFLLLSSYSFFNQSLVIKFYSLNLFIILLVSYFALKLIVEKKYDKRFQHISAFLLGLSTANHHTGLIVILPLTFVIVVKFKYFIKNFLKSFFLFFCGASVNLYLLALYWKKNYFKLDSVSSVTDLLNVYLLRGNYGKGSTVYAVKSAFFSSFFHNFTGILKNVYFIFSVNFPYFLVWAFLTIIFIINTKKQKFTYLFLIIAFLSYSLLLGKLTLPVGKMNLRTFYLAAHQYFLPGFAFFAIISSIGLYEFIKFFQNRNFTLIKYVSFAFVFLPLIVFPQRFFDSLHSTNYAPYQTGKDHVSELPVNATYVSFGDLFTFLELYTKNVLHYREDIFNASMPSITGKHMLISKAKIMGKYYFYEQFPVKSAIRFIEHKEVYISSKSRFDNSIFKDYFILKDYNLNFKLIPGFYEVKKDNIGVFEKKYDNSVLKNFINPYPCVEHNVDDLMTVSLCRSYYLKNTVVDESLKAELYKWNNIVDYYTFKQQER